ncbi:MAG: hypothetical protein KJN84_08690 [Bacteroidia bacterium]|nr:hypothetical protein [Bacteroidia bacterium]
MTFFDEEGNEILLRYVKNLNINDEHVWEQNFDMFLVKYDNPKWKTYLCYRFNFDHFNEEDNNEKTIKSDNLTVGGKTYHDVIHLDYPLHDGMPYGIFYTQKDGIFMIRDYDLEQTWVLDKIIFKQ